MDFSRKRPSKLTKSMLVVAKSHAVNLQNLSDQRLIVCACLQSHTFRTLPNRRDGIAESWVTKGPNQFKRYDMKGRGRAGIKVHPHSRLHVVLKEGKTRAEQQVAERQRKLSKIMSAGLVREDVPIRRSPGASWAW